VLLGFDKEHFVTLYRDDIPASATARRHAFFDSSEKLVRNRRKIFLLLKWSMPKGTATSPILDPSSFPAVPLLEAGAE
jgi:hypothetical protein